MAGSRSWASLSCSGGVRATEPTIRSQRSCVPRIVIRSRARLPCALRERPAVAIALKRLVAAFRDAPRSEDPRG
jgi:hypothetical protein